MISTLADLSNSIDQIIKEMSSDELNSGLLIRSVALEHRYNPSWLELGAAERERVEPTEDSATTQSERSGARHGRHIGSALLSCVILAMAATAVVFFLVTKHNLSDGLKDPRLPVPTSNTPQDTAAGKPAIPIGITPPIVSKEIHRSQASIRAKRPPRSMKRDRRRPPGR